MLYIDSNQRWPPFFTRLNRRILPALDKLVQAMKEYIWGRRTDCYHDGKLWPFFSTLDINAAALLQCYRYFSVVCKHQWKAIIIFFQTSIDAPHWTIYWLHYWPGFTGEITFLWIRYNHCQICKSEIWWFSWGEYYFLLLKMASSNVL